MIHTPLQSQVYVAALPRDGRVFFRTFLVFLNTSGPFFSTNYRSFQVRSLIDRSNIFKNAFYVFSVRSLFRNIGIVLDNSVRSRERTIVL